MRHRAAIHVWHSVGLSVFLLAGVLISCGGDGGGKGGPPAACGVGPCGGDLVGTWSVTDLCVDNTTVGAAVTAAFADLCPQVTVRDLAVDATGSVRFGADASFQAALVVTGSATVDVPTACLEGATCALANAIIQADLEQNPDPDIQSVTCAGTTTCACTVTMRPVTTTESGTYTASGSSLTMTPAGQTADTLTYCVQGPTIILHGARLGSSPTSSAIGALIGTKASS